MKEGKFDKSPKSEYHQVESGNEPIRIRYPDIAGTVAIDTCHALGILNREGKIGYLGHFINFDNVSAEELLDTAIREAGGPKSLKVGLAGNIPPPQEETDSDAKYKKLFQDYMNFKDWLLRLVVSKGISPKNFQNHLAESPSHDAYAMEVNTLTGTITVTKEKEED